MSLDGYFIPLKRQTPPVGQTNRKPADKKEDTDAEQIARVDEKIAGAAEALGMRVAELREAFGELVNHGLMEVNQQSGSFQLTPKAHEMLAQKRRPQEPTPRPLHG